MSDRIVDGGKGHIAQRDGLTGDDELYQAYGEFIIYWSQIEFFVNLMYHDHKRAPEQPLTGKETLNLRLLKGPLGPKIECLKNDLYPMPEGLDKVLKDVADINKWRNDHIHGWWNRSKGDFQIYREIKNPDEGPDTLHYILAPSVTAFRDKIIVLRRLLPHFMDFSPFSHKLFHKISKLRPE